MSQPDGKLALPDVPNLLLLTPGKKAGEIQITILKELAVMTEVKVITENPEALNELFGHLKGMTLARGESIEGAMVYRLAHI